MDQANTDRLRRVLEALPNHNLEGRITYNPTQPMTSYGAQSEIYQGFYVDAFLRDLPLKPRCLVCQADKEVPETETCNQCKTIWVGKLAIKKFRTHVQDVNHHKVCSCAFFRTSLLIQTFPEHSQRTRCLLEGFAFQCPPLYRVSRRE